MRMTFDLTRREVIAGLAASLVTCRDLVAREVGAAADRAIASLEVIKVQGRREVSDAHQQHQVHPSHIWRVPAEYREPPQPGTTMREVSALYVRIRTKGGAEGLYGPIDHESVPVLQRDLGPWLAGRDALAIEALWDGMHRANRHGRAGHYMMAISAADNALWDLRGRVTGLPVFRLLGGNRSRVPVYASCLGFSLEPDAVERTVARLSGEGYAAQKWFFAHGPGDGREGLAKNVDLVRRVRAAAGDGVDIMFDAFMGWDLPYALTFVEEIEAFRPRWIEEPFPTDLLESFVALGRATSVPIASGEHIYGRWEAERYLQAGAIRVLQADPEWCGGASELVRMCALASVHDAHVVPHGHALRSALHVIASQSPATCPMGEYLIVKMALATHPWFFPYFEQEPLRVERGTVVLPDTPGFGIALDPAKVETQTVL
jgi:L-alanine-DL-glutamate epimerase-like enolase superfamily enzyme